MWIKRLPRHTLSKMPAISITCVILRTIRITREKIWAMSGKLTRSFIDHRGDMKEEFQDHEALFKSGAKMDGTGKNEALKEQAFPSIKHLRSDAVLESGGTNKRHTISGLEINDTANDKASLYEAVEGKYDKSAGLFLTNSSIDHSGLDNISVEGDNSVGAFCGIEQGTLKDLTVKNSDGESVIKGDFYVGGIVGIREAKDKDGDVVYEGLTNYAKVTGRMKSTRSFFGEVIGELKAEKEMRSR